MSTELPPSGAPAPEVVSSGIAPESLERFKNAMKREEEPSTKEEAPPAKVPVSGGGTSSVFDPLNVDQAESWPKTDDEKRQYMGQSVAFMFPLTGAVSVFVQGSFFKRKDSNSIDLEGLYGRIAYTSIENLINRANFDQEKAKMFVDKVHGFWNEAHRRVGMRA